jgi:hypothetical protein
MWRGTCSASMDAAAKAVGGGLRPGRPGPAARPRQIKAAMPARRNNAHAQCLYSILYYATVILYIERLYTSRPPTAHDCIIRTDRMHVLQRKSY